MNEMQETRYPFLSFREFMEGGYWTQPAAVHLTLGLVFQIVFCAYVFSRRRRLAENATICYFALAVYNNIAYTVSGVRFNEFFGILASLAVIGDSVVLSRRSRVSRGLLLTGGLVLAHATGIAIVYAVDADWSARLLRLMLVSKIFVLGFCILAIERHFQHRDSLERLVGLTIAAALVACFLYLLQAVLYAGGLSTYGTYKDAGLTGVASFGSVSLERGHFGKFLTPLFPFFLLVRIQGRKTWPFALFLFVSVINFSASSMSFLVGYLTLTLVAFRDRIMTRWGLRALPAIVALATFVLIRFRDQYEGILEKIRILAIVVEPMGGRSVELLNAYVERYPLGTSYGGSTLRIAGGLPQIEMGAFSFIAQFGVFCIPLLLAFLLLNVGIARRSAGLVDPVIRQSMLIGMAMSILVYSVDVLWFVPTTWAPLVVLSALSLRADAVRTANGALTSPGKTGRRE